LIAKPKTGTGAPVLTLIQYDGDSIFEEEFDTFEGLMRRFDPSKVNWINVDSLSDVELLRKLGDVFNIHPLALEDVLNTTQRPKVEQFADHFFIVSEMIYEAGMRIALEQLSVFLGKSFVLTIQEESEHDVFEQIRSRLRAGRGYARKMKADYLAYALLDATVDQFYPILESLGESVEKIEAELLRKPSRETLRRLYETKRLLLQLRRTAWPQREIFNTLIRDDSGLVSKETQIFLRDCYDHTTQIIDILESYRDLAAGLMDIYLSSLSFRTNEIMRVLTVISASSFR
jgi:magnesium transporter